jgi:hydroxyacylglutathione hydrolase
VISDSTVSDNPLVAFTGDTLFVNEVGRTDLVDPRKTDIMARKLYQSLHEKLLPIGDGVIVHPGHGEGSVCGGDIGAREFSTIGYEKRNNPWLNMNEEEFVKGKKNQNLTLAAYFKHCEKLNTVGPPMVSELPPPKLLDADSFESSKSLPDHVVVDTRAAHVFRQFHIPDSISMDIDHMGLFAGWILDPYDKFLLVLQQTSDLNKVNIMLQRVGVDRIEGYLGSGIDSWVNANKNLRSLKQYSLEDLMRGREQNTVDVVDIRQTHEFEKNHIPDSISVPLTEIADTPIASEKPIVTMCPSGIRSTTGASLLLRKGIKEVLVPLEGLKTWEQRGYPLVHD